MRAACLPHITNHETSSRRKSTTWAHPSTPIC